VTERCRSVTLVIPGDVADLSPNRVSHLQWTQGGRYRLRDLKASWKLRARSAWNTSGERGFLGRVRISYVIYRGRKHDEDNLSSSLALKSMQDALTDHAYPNDDPRYVVRGTVQQVIDKQYRESPKVLMILEALDNGG
jgi:hypothetical protein